MSIDPLPWANKGPLKIWAELPQYPKELNYTVHSLGLGGAMSLLLAGISLQSPLEAGNAFAESL